MISRKLRWSFNFLKELHFRCDDLLEKMITSTNLIYTLLLLFVITQWLLSPHTLGCFPTYWGHWTRFSLHWEKLAFLPKDLLNDAKSNDSSHWVWLKQRQNESNCSLWFNWLSRLQEWLWLLWVSWTRCAARVNKFWSWLRGYELIIRLTRLIN